MIQYFKGSVHTSVVHTVSNGINQRDKFLYTSCNIQDAKYCVLAHQSDMRDPGKSRSCRSGRLWERAVSWGNVICKARCSTCATPSSGEPAPAAKDTESVRDRDQPRCNTRQLPCKHALASAVPCSCHHSDNSKFTPSACFSLPNYNVLMENSYWLRSQSWSYRSQPNIKYNHIFWSEYQQWLICYLCFDFSFLINLSSLQKFKTYRTRLSMVSYNSLPVYTNYIDNYDNILTSNKFSQFFIYFVVHNLFVYYF